ncbi:choline oxidase [Trichophyton equinum CBS 127.97]|uniref:Choline oxidase n=1 Tax=Trichophyton equinum (strain ATCC MYA-4606 / CBS 127.97) TaxID=559882 RepID=F2PN90_TRIEC|nr:choline oxidase [Trichophyton equinum CBS 127.97]
MVNGGNYGLRPTGIPTLDRCRTPASTPDNCWPYEAPFDPARCHDLRTRGPMSGAVQLARKHVQRLRWPGIRSPTRRLWRRCKMAVIGAAGTGRWRKRAGSYPEFASRRALSALSIPVVKDVPGVGENLVDHPESIIMWELNQPVPPNQTTMDSDAGVFLRREPINAAGFDGDCADIMMHCYQIPFGIHTGRLGYDVPANAFCVTPNIPRPRSRGRLYLTSADPTVKPALDFRYFTDPEGYDAATIVAGLKAARKIAEEEPFKKWIKREVAPGPATTTDEELSAYGRSVHHTVYHPAGTTKMGDIQKDRMAVVDPTLKIRGLKNVRIADAGVFPDMPSINPMLTVLGVGERAAELIAEEAGWRPSSSRL